MNIHDQWEMQVAKKIPKKYATSLKGSCRSFPATVEQPKNCPFGVGTMILLRNVTSTSDTIIYVSTNMCIGNVRCSYILELNRSKNSKREIFVLCHYCTQWSILSVDKKPACFWPLDVYMDRYQSCKEINIWLILLGATGYVLLALILW